MPRSRSVDDDWVSDPANVTWSLLSWCWCRWVAHGVKSVFAGFNFRRLDAIHCAMSSMQSTRRCSASPASCCRADTDTHSCESSALKRPSSRRVYSLHRQGRQCIERTGVDPTPILGGLHTAYSGSRTQCPQTAQCNSDLTSSSASNSACRHVLSVGISADFNGSLF